MELRTWTFWRETHKCSIPHRAVILLRPPGNIDVGDILIHLAIGSSSLVPPVNRLIYFLLDFSELARFLKHSSCLSSLSCFFLELCSFATR